MNDQNCQIQTSLRLQRRAGDLLIIVGTQTLDPPFTSAHESVLSVRRIITHPLYGTAAVRPWAYDLALLQLDVEPSYEDVRWVGNEDVDEFMDPF
jgi:hypothetical protein